MRTGTSHNPSQSKVMHTGRDAGIFSPAECTPWQVGAQSAKLVGY